MAHGGRGAGLGPTGGAGSGRGGAGWIGPGGTLAWQGQPHGPHCGGASPGRPPRTQAAPPTGLPAPAAPFPGGST
eukprot:15484545-Alexandrium_andersonii.AAC.1